MVTVEGETKDEALLSTGPCVRRLHTHETMESVR